MLYQEHLDEIVFFYYLQLHNDVLCLFHLRFYIIICIIKNRNICSIIQKHLHKHL